MSVLPPLYGIFCVDRVALDSVLEQTAARASLSTTRYQLSRPWRGARGTRLGLHAARSMGNAALVILSRAVQMERIARREQYNAIVDFTGEFYDPPGA